MEEHARILVVDDEAKNRKLLGDILEARGYHVTKAEDGRQALDRVAEDPPDVILLDVMMPGMDGFEVCRRIKDDPATAPIPVLLVTVLREREDRLRGMEAGANDFITKPIDTQEVVLRVKNAAHAKDLFDTVQESLTRLEKLEALRDNLTHMIVHDMRSPLMGISRYMELLKRKAGDALDEKGRGYVDQSLASTAVLVEMVSSLLDVSTLESGQMTLSLQECDCADLARAAIDEVGATAAGTGTSVDVEGSPAPVRCDCDLIRRVFVNLVANAFRFTPDGGNVVVRTEKTDGGTKASVTDTGPGIPREFHEKIFEKFGQVEGEQRRQYSTGLGLTFCKLAVEAHGGRIGLESEPGRGSTFWFVLPEVSGDLPGE